MKIKYRCKHLTCRNDSCYEGVVDIDEDRFNRLSAVTNDIDTFKSPKGVCKIGFPQDFEVLEIEGQTVKTIPTERLEQEIEETQQKLLNLRETHREEEDKLKKIITQKQTMLRQRYSKET